MAATGVDALTSDLRGGIFILFRRTTMNVCGLLGERLKTPCGGIERL